MLSFHDSLPGSLTAPSTLRYKCMAVRTPYHRTYIPKNCLFGFCFPRCKAKSLVILSTVKSELRTRRGCFLILLYLFNRNLIFLLILSIYTIICRSVCQKWVFLASEALHFYTCRTDLTLFVGAYFIPSIVHYLPFFVIRYFRVHFVVVLFN